MSVEYKSNLRKIAAQIDDEMRAALKDTADDIADLAQQLAPEDTGDLKRSKQVTQDGNGWIVSFGEGLTYAAHVEYGTADSPAQPYLTPAVENIDPLFRAKERLNALISRNRM